MDVPRETTRDDSITSLLHRICGGDNQANEQLWELVYEELHKLTRAILAREQGVWTPQTTVLLHEAYLRLADQRCSAWHDRRHFFAIAARVVRRTLIDWIRTRGRQKRGGDQTRVPLELDSIAGDFPADDIVALDEALSMLDEVSSRSAQVVELRFFFGLRIDEVAEVLDVSPRTVKAEWEFARTWLHRQLRK